MGTWLETRADRRPAIAVLFAPSQIDHLVLVFVLEREATTSGSWRQSRGTVLNWWAYPAFLTTFFDDMKDTINTIRDAGLRDKVTILVGGGPVDQATADYVGADYYCRTAQDGVIAAKNVLGVN